MTLSNPRTIPKYAVGFAWQTAEGTAASSGDAQIILVEEAQGSSGAAYVHQHGTSGSQFQKTTHQLVARVPTASLKLYAGVHQLAPFLESATRGQPTVDNADVTESGDDNNFLSSWSLTGFRPGFNSDDSPSSGLGTIYVSVTDETPGAGQARVSLYSDSGRNDLVAQGDGADNSTVTLDEQNDSGLSGTVDIATVTANDTDVEIEVGKMTLANAEQPTRFFTLWLDNGQEVEKFTDCAVMSINFNGQDRGPLYCDVEVVAKDYTTPLPASTLTPALEKDTFLVFQNLTLTTDTSGDDDQQFPADMELSMETDIRQYVGSAANPQKLIAERAEISGSITLVAADGSDELFDRGQADTEDAWKFAFSDGTRKLTITLPFVKIVEPMKAQAQENEMGDEPIDFLVVEDAGATSNPILMELEA